MSLQFYEREELLKEYPDTLKIMPTFKKTPYLCYTAIYNSEDSPNLYLYAYVPVSIRLKVLCLYLYFEQNEFNTAYSWFSDLPHIRPPNEGKMLILTTNKCLVCNSKTDNMLDLTYHSIEGYHCCLDCLEKLDNE
jgi:hypothetical protein